MHQLRSWAAYAVLLVAAVARDAGAEVDLGAVEDVESLSLSDLLEQPVTAASRYAQKPGGSPTLVSRIDAELIHRLGHRTLGDALRALRGVYTSNDRNYGYVGARGFSLPGDYNTRFALSINNHPINDPVYGQAPTSAELGLPMIAIDHVELIRGGAWSVHGQSALLGAIQVITATGATRPGLNVTTTSRLTAESFADPAGRPAMAPRGQDIAASYGAVENGYDVFVAGSYTYDPGLRALYFPELAGEDGTCVDRRRASRACDGVVVGNDGEEVGSLFASLSKGDLAIRMLAARRRKQVATASFDTLVGAPSETLDDRAFLEAEYTRARETSDLVGRVTADYFSYRGTYPYPDAVSNDDRSGARWVGGELRGRRTRETYGRYLRDLEIGAGVAGSWARAAQSNRDVTPDETTLYLDRVDRVRIASLFGHASARAFDHVVGFAAARGDYHPDSIGGVVSPQLGFVLDGGQLGRVRASMSRGYRAPGVYERYWAAAYNGLEPPKLGRERSETRELSIERYLGEHVRALAVVFQQDVHDLVTVVGDGSTLFTNSGSVRSRGLELEVEGRWDRALVRASYVRQHARSEDGATPPNSPDSLTNLTLLVPVLGGRGDVAVESWYMNKRTSLNGDVLPPLFMTNVVLTAHRVTDQLDLSLGITNLFDQRGGVPGSDEHRQGVIPHDPRIVWVRIGVALP